VTDMTIVPARRRFTAAVTGAFVMSTLLALTPAQASPAVDDTEPQALVEALRTPDLTAPDAEPADAPPADALAADAEPADADPAPGASPADGDEPAGAHEQPPAAQDDVVGESEPVVRLVVDSLDFGGPDATPGDGVCATAAGTCTLRAALEESNALNRPAGEVLITVAEGLSGTIVPDGTNTAAASNRPNWMFPTATGSPTVSTRDTGGAFYRITAPVTIDLDNRLSINDGTYATSEGAAFFVDGPGVTFRNVSQIFGSGSSFVMGPNADGVLIDGGETRTRASNAPKRFITFRSGSRNVTLRNYTVSGFAHHATGTSANASRTGLLWFDSAANTTFTNYTIDNVLFDYPTSGSCTATDGTGCATSLIDFRFRNSNSNIRVVDFTFTNSRVQNMPGVKGVFGFPFSDGETVATNDGIRNYGVQLTNLQIVDNEFVNNRRHNPSSADPKKYGAFIVLPITQMVGNNVIARNYFERAEPGVTGGNVAGLNPYAIYHRGLSTGNNNTIQANMAIVDNHFDGYASVSTIRLHHAGQETVARNTFGTRTGGSSAGEAEEASSGNGLYVSSGTQSNRKINTWHPTAAVAARQANQLCRAEVEVTALSGTGNQVPQTPIYLDVYWTTDRTAEVYLGTYGPFDSQTAQRLAVDLPEVGSPALRWIAEQHGANVPVDPDTDEVHGFVRLQTHSAAARGSAADGDLESSQYSRVAALTGNCAVPPDAPRLDPTSGLVVSGWAQPGAEVVITDAGTGVEICRAVADPGTGRFACAPATWLLIGSVVDAYARDGHGNVSPVATVTVAFTGPPVELRSVPRVQLVDALPRAA